MTESKATGPPGIVYVVLIVGGLLGGGYWYAETHLLSHRIYSTESCAIEALQTCRAAQHAFHKIDHYGIAKHVYANPIDGSGFVDLYETGGVGSGGKALRLIDKKIARAEPGGRAKDGYYFADITGDARGPYDYTKQWGLCAVPASYNRTGRNVFIIDVAGTVYQKNAAALHPGLAKGDVVPPLTVWPDATGIASWIPVGYP